MARMTRPRGGRPSSGTRGVAPRAAALLLGSALLFACSDDPSSEPPAPPGQMALSVETGRGAGSLSERAQADAETEVGDVLSHYVVAGFLGDFPRENFVDAFDAFTGGAAASAAGDLDLLTANRYRDASAVRPTRLDARLSFLVDGQDVVGASARVNLGFEADLPGGDTVPFTLSGRLLLEEDDGTWSVFGYDVARDDAAPVGAEVTP
jgi:hypothetical protein